MEESAPIVLFVYNRPVHTLNTLEALLKNKLAAQSDLFIYADGPKEGATPEQLEQIKEVRKVIRQKQWCKNVNIIESSSNNGLAASIIKGVTEIVNRYGKIIVLEDDILTSPFFLDYCNSALEIYKNAGNVYSVNGFMFPANYHTGKQTFLCPLATSSWGWATWKDRWAVFESEITQEEMITKNEFIKQRFNFGGIDYTGMMSNKNSWAIKWYYSVFIRNGLGLFPVKTLVYNSGFDGSGTNTGVENLKADISLTNPQIIYQESIDWKLTARLYDYLFEKYGRRENTGNNSFFAVRQKLKKLFFGV